MEINYKDIHEQVEIAQQSEEVRAYFRELLNASNNELDKLTLELKVGDKSIPLNHLDRLALFEMLSKLSNDSWEVARKTISNFLYPTREEPVRQPNGHRY